MRTNQAAQKTKILFTSPSVLAGKEQEQSRNDFVSLTGKPIGEGAFGDVWKVRHKGSGNVFAIKCIQKQKIIECKMQEQLNREIRIMYSLNHPNIIKLFNHFEDAEFCYLILEFAPNENLWSFLNRKKQLDEITAAQYIRETALAVEYLHNKDPPVIHRDIKPENILLDSNFSAKLCDFGWSNFFNENRTRKTYCGTLDYLAPEMIKKQGHDTSLDLWNLGVLLFELLTGKAPFQGKNQQELFDKITKVQITWPKGFPPLAKDLILKLLKANPEERISIQELLNHRWTKSHTPLRDTVTNDLTNREKLPENESGEVQMKESEYVVVSTPQTKLQYQNLKIETNLGVEETKQHLQIQEHPTTQQAKTQEQANLAQSSQQNNTKEAEIVKYKQMNKELKQRISRISIQEIQSQSSYEQKIAEQLRNKQHEVKSLQSEIQILSIKSQDTQNNTDLLNIENQRDQEQFNILNKLLLLIQINLQHQTNVVKDEMELIKSNIIDISLKSQSLDNQQITFCKEALNKMSSQINFDSTLQKFISNQDVQLQALNEQVQQKEGTAIERSVQKGNNEDQKSLQQKLKESLEQQNQYKEQLQIINKFWEMDKKKIEDMKQELSTYESLVKNFRQNMK